MRTESPSGKVAAGDTVSLAERQDHIVYRLRQRKPDLLQRLIAFVKQFFGQR